jgi:integrase
MLQKLHQAGVINLGSTVVNTDSRLVTWEYDWFKRNMIAVQKLRPTKFDGRGSTVECRLRYIRFLESHPEAPVQLRPPHESSWLDHVAYRMEEEEATGAALNQSRKALKSLLRALGLPMWASLEKSFQEVSPHWNLPPDDLVPQFWERATYVDEPSDELANETIRHMMHWGFHGGNRPPSELAALNVPDVRFADRAVVVTEVKKGGRRRELVDIEPFVIDAPNGKSLRHYIEHVRPKLAKRSKEETNAFFLDPKGERWHPNELGWALSKAGKAIWPEFIPYTMRRWCATTRLIDSGFNVYYAADWLGDTVATVEKHYVAKAEARAGMKGRFRMHRRRLHHAQA